MRRHYLREAALTLLLAKVIVGLFPPRQLFAWVNRPPRQLNRFAQADVDWIAWAVDTMAVSRWVNAACLPRALAVYVMLRRRGILSRLSLGVALDRETVTAHAWVEVGNKIVGGGAQGDRFTPIAHFGGSQ